VCWGSSSRAESGVVQCCTTRFENAHGTELRELLYRWHPWFGLRVSIHVVSALQKALASYGGPNTPTDPGPIDGDFGPRTESAVRAYQSDRGVIADGVVGDQTWWVPAGAAGRTSTENTRERLIGAAYWMSAMPRQRPISAAQGNDATCQKPTYDLTEDELPRGARV
jgi:peptidoglycan hydrolase-like protein with peptidoglycan-binding domain